MMIYKQIASIGLTLVFAGIGLSILFAYRKTNDEPIDKAMLRILVGFEIAQVLGIIAIWI